MSTVLIVAEQLDGALRRPTLSALKAGRPLADRLSAKLHVLLLGQNLAAAAQDLAGYGGDGLHVADAPELNHPLAEAHSQVIAQAAQDLGADSVLATPSSQSKAILPRVAARLGAGMASDVLAFAGEGSNVTFRRPMWAGA